MSLYLKSTLFIFLFLAAPALGELRHYLDSAQDFVVELRQNKAGELVAVLTSDKSDRRIASKDFLETLQQGLNLSVDGKRIPVKWGHADTREYKGPSGAIEIDLFGKSLGSYSASPGNGQFTPTSKNSYVLSSYDIREFGQRGIYYAPEWEPLPREIDRKAIPQIDLHTHLAGSFSYQSLVTIGRNHQIPYPTQLLRELQIKYPADKVKTVDGKEVISMNDLMKSREWKESQGDRKLQEALSIGRTKIRNFTQMEDRYQFRNPITKNRDAVESLLWKAAREAKASGVDYAEFSISDVLDPKWLQKAHDVLPEIERTTGVKVRFLVGLWRHSDEAWNLDEIEKIKHLAKTSPYIVGVDWMGHETNSTKDIKRQIDEMVKAAPQLGKNFQIRVHAGENPLHPENLREAVLAGATRIGHGLYSDIDEATMKLIKDRGVVIELNPLSNQALNNLSSNIKILVEQFKKYRAAGIRVTFGTDGSGMYGGTAEETYRMMRQMGLNDSDIAYAKESDKAYRKSLDADFEAKIRIPENLRVNANLPPATHWKPEMQDQKDRERTAKIKNLNDNLAEKGILKITEKTQAFKGMRPIMVTGSSMSHFPEIEKQEKVGDIEKVFEALLSKLNPKSHYFITGGTDFGVEKILHRMAREKGFQILGVLPEEANPNEVRLPSDGGITHWIDGGKTWYAKALIQYDLVAEGKGDIIAIGGKNILADELAAIKAGEKQGLARLHLMKDVVGAAHDLAQRIPENGFSTPDELIARLEQHWAGSPMADFPLANSPSCLSGYRKASGGE